MVHEPDSSRVCAVGEPLLEGGLPGLAADGERVGNRLLVEELPAPASVSGRARLGRLPDDFPLHDQRSSARVRAVCSGG